MYERLNLSSHWELSFRRSLAHHLRYLLVAHTGDNMHLWVSLHGLLCVLWMIKQSPVKKYHILTQNQRHKLRNYNFIKIIWSSRSLTILFALWYYYLRSVKRIFHCFNKDSYFCATFFFFLLFYFIVFKIYIFFFFLLHYFCTIFFKDNNATMM